MLLVTGNGMDGSGVPGSALGCPSSCQPWPATRDQHRRAVLVLQHHQVLWPLLLLRLRLPAMLPLQTRAWVLSPPLHRRHGGGEVGQRRGRSEASILVTDDTTAAVAPTTTGEANAPGPMASSSANLEKPDLDLRKCKVCKAVAYSSKGVCLNKKCEPRPSQAFLSKTGLVIKTCLHRVCICTPTLLVV